MIEQGVLTVAQNTDVDYARLAYLQCLSLKLTNPGLPYAIVTDAGTQSTFTDAMRSAFDHIVILNHDQAWQDTWKQRNEGQLFDIAPFRETIKVEADLLFTGNISHWWPALRRRDMVISRGCVDYRGQTGASRRYRQLHDDNDLPDVYTGLMYWRRCPLAHQAFELVKQLHQHWDAVRQELIMCQDPGSNDVVFSVMARIVGEHLVTLPWDAFRMVHLKPAINGWDEAQPWHDQVSFEINAPAITVSGYQQTHPVHYHEKSWATDAMIQEYEHELG